MPRKSPADDEVVAGLQRLLRRGLPVTPASADTVLLNLRGIVARAVDPADEASRTAALDGTLRGLLARFPTRYATAARALFGLPPATPGQNLTVRPCQRPTPGLVAVSDVGTRGWQYLKGTDYSLTRGTPPMIIRRTVPDEPKSIVAVARGPLPSVATTVPRPYLSWVTRSPTSSASTGASCQPRNGVERNPRAATPAWAESPPVTSAL